MKKYLVLLFIGLTLLPLNVSMGAEKPMSDRFYGKLTKVDMDKKIVTVHNKRRDLDASFIWDHETNFVSQKKPIQANDLKLGQSLIVSYVTEEDTNKAKRITVRASPAKKKPTTSLID